MRQGGFTPRPVPQHWHSIDTLNAGLVAPQQSPATSGLSDVAYYVPLMVREQVTLKKLWLACSGTGNNLDLGLYDASGTRLVSSGSTAHPGSTTELVVDVTDTVISPGIYFFAASLSGSNTIYIIDVGVPLRTAFGAYYQTSAFPLPSSASFSAGGRFLVGGTLINTVV